MGTFDKNIKISILLTTFNGSAYLDDQIRSLLNQSWLNFEIIAVDDGSTDETQSLMARYAVSDPRLTFIVNQKNLGQKVRLAEAFGLSQGDYIAISDQDDIWDSEKLSILIRSIGSNAMAFGRSELIDANGLRLNRTLLDVCRLFHDPRRRLTSLVQPMVSAHAMLMKRSILSLDALNNEDSFDHLMSLDAMFSDGLVYADNAIVYHRIHHNNQNNGFVLSNDYTMPRFSRFKHMIKLPFRLRREFLGRCRYLGNSSNISTDVRDSFQSVYVACFNAWSLRKDVGIASRQKLKSCIEQNILKYSGSAEDERFFLASVSLMLYAVPHPVAARNALRAMI